MIEAGQSYDGGCLCGAVRYRLLGPSVFECQCCCKDCQKATGTGHTTIVGVHKSQLIVDGEPKIFTNQGESGGDVSRHFCGECGGRLYTSGSLPGELIMIQAGSLDAPDAVDPAEIIYTRDAVAWDHLNPELPAYELYAPFSDEAVAAMKGRPPKGVIGSAQ